MARKTVVEIHCDRCKRTEYQPETSSMVLSPDLELTFMGDTVKYHDLCSRCKRAITNYIRQVKREGKDLETETEEIPVELESPQV